MKILSLGWGVQSFTLAAMVAMGELEPIDAAIHADTTHESLFTYKFSRNWTPWLEERGVKVITVQNAANPVPDEKKLIDIPAYTRGQKEDGTIQRRCTFDWKIAPIRRWLQKNRDKKPVEMWVGISKDEFRRMRDSDVKYITNRWPLIEKNMTRTDCVEWLEEHGIEVPKKSSCVFCPYHSTQDWRDTKNESADWFEAIKVDRAIRDLHHPYELFVHPSRKPLEEVDLRTAEEKGQLSLWDAECSGICGV